MLRSLNISTLAKASGVAVIVGFLSVCVVGVFAVRELKVGGPLYERIVLGKDLVADILPPPEYIIEAFLEANLAVQQPETVEQRAARLKQLQKEYNERHEFWLKQDFDLTVRKTLTGGRAPSRRTLLAGGSTSICCRRSVQAIQPAPGRRSLPLRRPTPNTAARSTKRSGKRSG